MKKKKMLAAVLAAFCLLQGCASAGVDEDQIYIDQVPMEELQLEDEMVPLANGPAAVTDLLMPEASGKLVKTGGGAEIDYSNVKDGYVMVRFAAANSKKLKVQVTGPSGEPYTYNLSTGDWVTYCLSDGNGSYKVTVYQQNPASGKYGTLASVSFQAALDDEFAPFLRPNQYVDYQDAKDTIAKAEELAGSENDPLKKVEKVYEYVVKNLTYDKSKASAVAKGQMTGYLPVLDSVLAEKKGICFDYAALMTGMLRSQGVPCKLVVGYAGSAYHAWVSVWTEKTGWIDGVIYFDGSTWQRMDPTFASSDNQSEKIMKYIGDGSNYTTKYLY